MDHFRIVKIIARSHAALEYLSIWGPSVLTKIAKGIGHEVQRTRYALTVLQQDGKAHISEFIRVRGADNIPRMVAVFSEGEGVDARLPGAEEEGLNFHSTQHLQQLIYEWTRTRTPDYVWDEEE